MLGLNVCFVIYHQQRNLGWVTKSLTFLTRKMDDNSCLVGFSWRLNGVIYVKYPTTFMSQFYCLLRLPIYCYVLWISVYFLSLHWSLCLLRVALWFTFPRVPITLRTMSFQWVTFNNIKLNINNKKRGNVYLLKKSKIICSLKWNTG